MNKFRAFDAVGKHGIKFRVYQYIGVGHEGLNTDVPTEFAAKRQVEPKLSRLAAYYFAHAIKNRSFLVKTQDHGSIMYALTVTLWFLAKDSVQEADSTEIAPFEPEIFGKGELSLEQVVNHYNETDFDVLAGLADCIQKGLRPYAEYAETGSIGGYLFLFVNEQGKQKLQCEWPKIWKDFNLG